MPISVRRALSVFERPRWSEEEAREVLTALERSGLSVGAFAAEHGLDPQRLYSWRRRLGASAEHTAFEELMIRAPPLAATRTRTASRSCWGRGRLCEYPRASTRRHWHACSRSWRGRSRAEPSAERAPVRGDAAGRRAQGRRQPDGRSCATCSRTTRSRATSSSSSRADATASASCTGTATASRCGPSAWSGAGSAHPSSRTVACPRGRSRPPSSR